MRENSLAEKKRGILDHQGMLKKSLRITVGTILVLLGLVGLMFPVIPGIIPLAIGLELIGLGTLIPPRIRKLWKKELREKAEKIIHPLEGKEQRRLETEE